MNQLNNPFVPQPPTYMPPAQPYKGFTRPIPTPIPPTEGVAHIPMHVDRTEKQKGQLFKIAFFAAIGFFLMSHHVAYRTVNSVWSAFTGQSREITCELGCPTTKGVFLHSFVFFVFMLILLFA